MDTYNAAGQTPNTPPSQPSGGLLKQIEDEIGKVYAKITFHLPGNVREFIVHYGPWITLVVMVLAIPAILLALGIGAVVAPAAMMYGGAHVGGFFFVSGLISLLALALEAMALPALFKRQMSGWRLLLYSTLVSAVGSLLYGNIGGLIIGTLLSLYVLYEIKSYYK